MLNKQQLEARVLEIADRVVRGQWGEDDFVEFKRQWPEPGKVHSWARRIAGHANAAGGHPILWIVGIDEKDGIVGADKCDLADLLPQLTKHFDASTAPDLLTCLWVQRDNKTLAALYFSTDRAPYVVTVERRSTASRGSAAVAISDEPKSATLEVPWRQGTRVNSAKREQLMRMLFIRKPSPRLDVLDASITYWPTEPGKQKFWSGQIDVHLFATLIGRSRIVWPFHGCGVRIRWSGSDQFQLQSAVIAHHRFDRHASMDGGPLPPDDSVSKAIHISDTEAVLNGSAAFFLRAWHMVDNVTPLPPDLELRCVLIDAEDMAATVATTRVQQLDPARSGRGEGGYPGGYHLHPDHMSSRSAIGQALTHHLLSGSTPSR